MKEVGLSKETVVDYQTIVAQVFTAIGAIISFHLIRTIGDINTLGFGSLIGSPYILVMATSSITAY